jgi:hypothetical protein
MNHYKSLPFVLILLIPLAIMMGCSRGSSTIIPDDTIYDSLPAVSDAGQIGTGSDRQNQGMWETSFDLADVGNLIGKTVPIEPIRTADLHLNVRPFISTPRIYIRSWNPTTETLDLEVDIYNTSIYNGHDIRLIIFRDTLGHKLLNPDNYTHLWDIPEGTYSNGFIAYAKDNDHRILHAGEWKTERLQILCPGRNFSIKFAIDASWPSNCEEPYMMNNFTQGMLQSYQGATSDITVDVYDWQDNVDSVRIQCSAITGQTDTYMTKNSGTKWGVELVNTNAVPEGDYFALIAATSSGSIDPLIHIVNVTVSPEVGNGWARTWGGVGSDSSYDVAVDNDGNIYVTGEFENTVDFNPDPNEDAIITSNGLLDAFLVKYDQHGDFQWVKSWGAEGDDRGRALDVDSDGFIYCGGEFRSTVDFDPGTGIDEKTSNGTVDSSLSKYSPDGSYIWTITWGGGLAVGTSRIKISTDGYIFVTGNFWSSSADFDPGPGQDIHSTHGYYDVFLSKFDLDGNFGWARTWGGSEDEYGNGIAVDSNGNVYCSGYFHKTVDFDPGPGEAIHEASGAYSDAFLSSFDADGNFRWVGTWGSTGADEAQECAVDEYDDVYVCGSFYYTVDFNPDPVDVEEQTAVYYNDGFVSKFDMNGDFQWVLSWGDANYDDARNLVISGDYFWVAGQAIADLDPGSGINYQEGKYLSKFDLTGNYQFSSVWSLDFLRYGISADNEGNIYLTGWFNKESLDFNPGSDYWHTDNFSGNWDCFVDKVLPNGMWE